MRIKFPEPPDVSNFTEQWLDTICTAWMIPPNKKEKHMNQSTMNIPAMIDIFVEAFPDTEYGPAHVVLSDYNVELDFLVSSLNRIRDIEAGKLEPTMAGSTPLELLVTSAFLTWLLSIPEEMRLAWDDRE